MALAQSSLPRLSFRRIVHGIVDSTSERAFAEIDAGRARHGDVHVALGQTSGRGRAGRPWWSEPGKGVYASVVLMPDTPYSPAALTIAGGLAALDAVRALGAVHAQLQWPNDVVSNDAKISGVLAETRGLRPERPSYVLGIGINVGQRSFPAELLAERGVTSLRLLGSNASVQATEAMLLARLAVRLVQIEQDPARLEVDFLAALALRGEVVRVSSGSEVHSGRLLGLSLGRGLELATPTGDYSLPLEWVRSIRG